VFPAVRNLTITSLRQGSALNLAQRRTVVDVENHTLCTRIKAVPLLIEILALPSELRRNLGGIRH